MFDDKLDFENDANITSTQQEILQLDGIYQGVMAGQGCGHTEDEVLDKMEKAAQSIGWTWKMLWSMPKRLRSTKR